jgi:hypothetical protein
VRFHGLDGLERLAWLDGFYGFHRFHRLAWLDGFHGLDGLAWLDGFYGFHRLAWLDRIDWLERRYQGLRGLEGRCQRLVGREWL